MQPGQQPQWRPLNRQDSHAAQQMVERAAELARDSHARTRHAAVLAKDGSLLAWGNNGVPFPGEDAVMLVAGVEVTTRDVAQCGNHDGQHQAVCDRHADRSASRRTGQNDGPRPDEHQGEGSDELGRKLLSK